MRQIMERWEGSVEEWRNEQRRCQCSSKPANKDQGQILRREARILLSPRIYFCMLVISTHLLHPSQPLPGPVLVVPYTLWALATWHYRTYVTLSCSASAAGIRIGLRHLRVLSLRTEIVTEHHNDEACINPPTSLSSDITTQSVITVRNCHKRSVFFF